MQAQLEFIDVTPRDGLQNESNHVATATKLELIQRLLDAGVRRLEVASFVHPKRVPRAADAEAVCAGLPAYPDARYIGFVLNELGYERAIRTGRLSEIGCVVCATDSFGTRNQGQTVAGGLAVVRSIRERARRDGLPCSITIAVAFGCPFEGDVCVERIADIAESVADGVPDEIVLADTIGVAVPVQVRESFEAVRARIGSAIPLRGHFHNTRNTAVANVQAAIQCGVTRFDSSLGGTGGCPFAPAATGNVATEDLAFFAARSGYATTLQLDRLIEGARWLGEVLGRSLPGMVSKAGPFPKRVAGRAR